MSGVTPSALAESKKYATIKGDESFEQLVKYGPALDTPEFFALIKANCNCRCHEYDQSSPINAPSPSELG